MTSPSSVTSSRSSKTALRSSCRMFCQAEDGIRDVAVTGVQTCALPICILFNQTDNTTVNILAVDLAPTLDGNPPTTKTQGSFTTVTCATPFALSAGVGFSTIEQKEFAIVKSNGGAGKSSVNKFETLNDSHVHPLPIAMLHVRLTEW